MKSVFNLKSLHFTERWESYNITFNGKVIAVGAKYELNGELFRIEPKTDLIGGYSVKYLGNVVYFKNVWELKRNFSKHWSAFFDGIFNNTKMLENDY